MATTVYDIAKAAGVGRTTVLRALWDRDDISPETKARIKKIAAELKYRPNHIARSLVTGQSNFVGIMATPSILPASHATIQLIETGLREAGYSMLLSISGGHPGGERQCLEQLIQNRVAGVIAIPASNSADPAIYQELVDSGVKMVTFDRCVEGLQTPQIIGDDYRSARLVTEHLISLGHERIVHLAIPQTSYAGRQRTKGFRDAMSEAGIRLTPSSIIETQFGEEFGARVTAQLLKRKVVPTAIIARHDMVAAGAIRAIYAAGLSIPGDISLVGNGDIWCSDILRIPLTTVRHPIQQMASIAIEKLLDMLSGKQVEPNTTVLDVDLIVRSSTAPPRRH
ncbi:MAG: LacI family DNA-binding transcriptional regulator [Armatimonadetes bacterium]|nr:LacI family DNA-binding transcriptional regulator [Armatimonadota bacterium]